jgi:hypothetical protein
MNERYPHYDVLAKRHTPSWNEKTRQVIDERLALPRDPRYLSQAEWLVLEAICERVVPQPRTRPPVPLAAMVDAKLFENRGDGYRDYRLPPLREAWQRGLHAIDIESRRRHNVGFAELDAAEQDALLRAVQEGAVCDAVWDGIPPVIFFAKRLLPDIVTLYYAHPTAWNEIGFGGPASPRGYVRMDFDRRDPWEAAEAKAGRDTKAARENSRVG